MADLKSRQQPKTLIYLYGITAAAEGARVGAPGVDGLAAVEPLAASGLTCWISRVPSSSFGDALARNMEDLEWLAQASVAHQAVVSAIAALADILPARFGTVFRDDTSLRRHVEQRQPAIAAALEKISGAEEWGVKVFAEPRPAAISPAVRSGKEYLQRKAAQLPQRSPESTNGDIAEFARALGRVADATAAGGAVSAGQRNLLWQGSFLVRRARHKQWQEVLNRFAAKWSEQRRIECTGPWPPYSFAQAQES